MLGLMLGLHARTHFRHARTHARPLVGGNTAQSHPGVAREPPLHQAHCTERRLAAEGAIGVA